MLNLDRNQLIEAGVQFGNLIRKRNPQMRPYIYKKSSRAHIIDLQKIIVSCQELGKYVESLLEKGKTILFLSTKKQMVGSVKEQAISTFKNLIKKEQVRLEKRRDKLNSIYEGVINLQRKPNALFIIGLDKEKTAFREAKKTGIPVIAICNTNCDPRLVDYVIPGNDRDEKSINFFANLVANTILKVKEKKEIRNSAEKEEKKVKEEF
ncbi:878_t:CDS:2 [Ambispora leptoticha]|uniref:878_t:CDS:1 n=1 Tax=Ambispora leptoticha TaxID=144679 RepID=A0A9N8W459_9GLOM|nr:878_t:CDS:2 [Ambispora leptoticha]